MTKPKPPPIRRAFAKRLKKKRVSEGFNTARELADVLGIGEDRYTRWERAETEPDITHIVMLCQTLRCDCNELVLGQLLPISEKRKRSIKKGWTKQTAEDGATDQPVKIATRVRATR